jgi:hypothetical protein
MKYCFSKSTYVSIHLSLDLKEACLCSLFVETSDNLHTNDTKLEFNENEVLYVILYVIPLLEKNQALIHYIRQ